MLCGQTIRGMFITALIGRVDTGNRKVELASCGHSPPLVVTRKGVIEVPVPGGPPLGIIPSRTMQARTHVLKPSEWLVAYTDGLHESFDEDRRPLDVAGVRNLLKPPLASVDEVIARLRKGEAKHRGATDPHDDMTVLSFGFS